MWLVLGKEKQWENNGQSRGCNGKGWECVVWRSWAGGRVVNALIRITLGFSCSWLFDVNSKTKNNKNYSHGVFSVLSISFLKPCGCLPMHYHSLGWRDGGLQRNYRMNNIKPKFPKQGIISLWLKWVGQMTAFWGKSMLVKFWHVHELKWQQA